VTGLKLTNNVVPRDGHVHAHSALGAFGPLCRDAGDARLFGSALLARDLPAGDGSGLRVGVVRDPFWSDIDPAVEKACEDALDASGWQVEEIDLDYARLSLIATVVIITVEALPEFGDEDIAAADPVSRALIKYERLMPAEALARAMRIRSQIRRALASAFETYDLIAWPTVPAVAPPIADPVANRPSGPAPADPANVGQGGLGNLTGIPGINVPVGFNPDGMPIGLMLQAAWNREELLLDAAEHIEQATGRRHVDAQPPIAAVAG
jgi:Asp-tRNA(Asn)/Glu-tRNA(Gln) amidotransferase A subunit family amidase